MAKSNVNISFAFIKYILIVVIPLMLIVRIYRLSKIDFDLDILNKQLTPLQSYIKPNTPIGFYINNQDAATYIAAQYTIAPHVIVNKTDTDTLLLIQDKSTPIKVFANYRVIIQNQYKNRLVSLITRVK